MLVQIHKVFIHYEHLAFEILPADGDKWSVYAYPMFGRLDFDRLHVMTGTEAKCQEFMRNLRRQCEC